MNMVPHLRIRVPHDKPVRPERAFILYWMIAARRPRWNFALQRAVDYARELNQPLVVFEPLRAAYPWASDRLHSFVLQGMADNFRRFEQHGITYLPYVEPSPGAGKGLLAALASQASIVITDDYPAFFLPRMVAATAKKLDVRLEAVDSNGLLPMRATDGVFARAFDFRRFLQNHLQPHLRTVPVPDPTRGLSASHVELPDLGGRWTFASQHDLDHPERLVSSLPIDHEVTPSDIPGGYEAASHQVVSFVQDRLPDYGKERNHPDADASSGLSPYLHFGHVSAHEVADAVWERENWSAERLPERGKGARQGWWGLSESAESFLDELVTWRELGFNMAWQRGDHDAYESLPEWARATLEQHETDPRDYVYDLPAFERAATHDSLWNAAQTQLVREGRMHNYLRMLWGKHILAWSESPRMALQIMIELNNKYALDGRDPNSVSGIFWVLGRYDRAWGPERPIFGKVRYMTSASTHRKLRLRQYLQRYGSQPSLIG